MTDYETIFEIPMFVLTMGLEGTAGITELHLIANELDLIEELTEK